MSLPALNDIKTFIMKRSAKILLLAVLLAGVAFAAEVTKIEQARQEAETYAQRSLAYRSKPARKLTAGEQKAEDTIKQAEALNAEADCAKDEDEAILLYRQAVKTAPNYAKSWSGLGMALWNRTNFMPRSSKEEKAELQKVLSEAKQACQKAIALDPKSVAGNYWLSNIIITEASLGNWLKGAVVLPSIFKLTDQVAAVDPYYENGAVFRTYAIVLATVPTWLSARFGYSPEIILPYLDKGIELAPNYFGNYTCRAGVYLKIGDSANKQKALQDLEFVLTHDPDKLNGYQADNRRQQKQAAQTWKQITGKNFPAR